jgi:hypothetical protein
VPECLWADGARLDEYLRRRLAASRTIEGPIAAFVPIADIDRLWRAWINEAPEPITEIFSSFARRDRGGTRIQTIDCRGSRLDQLADDCSDPCARNHLPCRAGQSTAGLPSRSSDR